MHTKVTALCAYPFPAYQQYVFAPFILYCCLATACLQQQCCNAADAEELQTMV